MVPVQITMDYIDTVSQYFYYMNAVDPEFGRTDLAEDMAVTLANGLNMAAEVMSTPEPERMCPWPGTGTRCGTRPNGASGARLYREATG